ncbi:MAG: hypothetical protein WBC91_07000 [Phototrophicaceae bacterium]
MPDDLKLNGLNSEQAVEEVAHEIRSRQLSILTLVQLLRRIDSGDVSMANLPSEFDIPQGLDSIQQCVHEISHLLDTLLTHMRDQDTR